MNKKLRYSLLTLLMAVFCGAWAQEVEYDLTSGWTFDSSAKTMTNGTVTFNAYGSASFKQNGGYVILGKQDAYLELPAYDFDVEKIEVVGHSGASGYVKQNIFVDDVAVSTETTGANGVTNTYVIAEDYQAAGNVYTLKVTSNHNTQIETIKVYKKQTSSDTRTAIAENIKFEPTSVTVGDEGFYTLTADYAENATYSFTIESSDEDMFTAFYRGDHLGEYVVGSETGTVEVTVTITPNDTNTYKPVSKTFTVTVMAAPLADIAALAAETTATATEFNVVFDNAVVTYVNGNNVYIQDESGAILYYKNGHGLTAGQILNGTATVKSALRNNNPQITALSGVTSTEGSAPLPTEVAAEDWDTPINTVLSQYFKVTGATITKNNNKYYVQLGEENVQLYGQGGASGFSLDDLETTYTIVGFPTMYNTTPELVIYEVPENENALEDPQLSYAERSVTVIFGKEYELPELNNPNSLEVEFQSSKEEVATVDEEGNVTLTGNEGSTTIKAIFSGNDVFESGEASYTLIVKLPAPVRAFQKVTSTDEITDGNYLIVYQGPKSASPDDDTEVSVAFNGGLETLDAVGNTIAVTVADDLIVTDQDAYFTINTTDGTLMSASGKYIGVSSYGNGLKQSDNAATYAGHSFSIAEDGNAVIGLAFGANTVTMRYNYAVDQQRFRYYKSGQKAIYLYKEIPTPEAVEVTIKDGFEGTTIASAYPLDLTQTEGLTAYIATGKVGTSKVYITTEAVNAVAPAQTGLLIKGDAGTYQIPVAKPADADETAFAANLLVGAVEGYTPTDTDVAAKTIYRYGKNASGCGFLLVSNTTQTVGAGKAYLRLTEEMAAAAAAYGIAFDGVEVTAIEGVAADSQNVNAPMFNLAGQRVNKSYKGVVIQNGKKMVK